MNSDASPEDQPSPSETSPSRESTQDEGVTSATDVLPNTSSQNQAALTRPQTQYDLRPTTLVSKQLPLTWIDTDQSGTYDPEEAREESLVTKRRRSRPELVDLENASPGAKKPRPNIYLTGRQRGDSTRIALKVSRKGNSKSQTMKNSTDKDDEPCDDSDSNFSVKYNLGDILDHNILPPGTKRARKSAPDGVMSAPDSANPTLVDTVMASLAAGISNSLTGRSRPRCCKKCKFLNIRCSLLEDGNRPCDSCFDNDMDCELAEPRKKKMPDVAEPVKIAGSSLPAAENSQSSTTKGSSVVTQPVMDITKDTISRPKAHAHSPGADQTTRPKCRAAVSCFDPAQTKIDTYFCHPISFSHEGDDPCHWCNNFNFGVLGYGEKSRVPVLDYYNGEGYIEIKGGHYENGQEPGKMCVECTMERLQILYCPSHDMRWIEGLDLSNTDRETILNVMMSHEGSISTAPYRYCSVCPTPAIVRCFAPQKEDTVINKEEAGCGLFLCKSCCSALEKRHKGNLTEMIQMAKVGEEPDSFPEGLRADAEWLTPGGELHKRIQERAIA